MLTWLMYILASITVGAIIAALLSQFLPRLKRKDDGSELFFKEDRPRVRKNRIRKWFRGRKESIGKWKEGRAERKVRRKSEKKSDWAFMEEESNWRPTTQGWLRRAAVTYLILFALSIGSWYLYQSLKPTTDRPATTEQVADTTASAPDTSVQQVPTQTPQTPIRQAPTPTPVGQAVVQAANKPWWMNILAALVLVLATVLALIITWVVYKNRQNLATSYSSVRGLFSKDVMITVLVTAVIQWFLWAIAHDRWNSFWNSPMFFPTIFAAFAIARVWKKNAWGSTGVELMTVGSLAVMFFPSGKLGAEKSPSVKVVNYDRPLALGVASSEVRLANEPHTYCPPSADMDTVKAAFPNNPEAWNIVYAEGRNCRQFTDSARTQVLRGAVDSMDTGIFQVNRSVWGDSLRSWNVDPNTLQGNIEATKRIIRQVGFDAWFKSERCWRYRVCSSNATHPTPPTTPLIAMEIGEVKEVEVPVGRPSFRIQIKPGQWLEEMPGVRGRSYYKIEQYGSRYEVNDSTCIYLNYLVTEIAYEAIDSPFPMVVRIMDYFDGRRKTEKTKKGGC